MKIDNVPDVNVEVPLSASAYNKLRQLLRGEPYNMSNQEFRELYGDSASGSRVNAYKKGKLHFGVKPKKEKKADAL